VTWFVASATEPFADVHSRSPRPTQPGHPSFGISAVSAWPPPAKKRLLLRNSNAFSSGLAANFGQMWRAGGIV